MIATIIVSGFIGVVLGMGIVALVRDYPSGSLFAAGLFTGSYVAGIAAGMALGPVEGAQALVWACIAGLAGLWLGIMVLSCCRVAAESEP
jgi:hypothetical protein